MDIVNPDNPNICGCCGALIGAEPCEDCRECEPHAVFAYDWPGVGLMYRIVGGPRDGSDVLAATLRELGIAVPVLSPREMQDAHVATWGTGRR